MCFLIVIFMGVEVVKLIENNGVIEKIRHWCGMSYLRWLLASTVFYSCSDEEAEFINQQHTYETNNVVNESKYINQLINDIQIIPINDQISSESFVKPDEMSNDQFSLFKLSFRYLVAINSEGKHNMQILVGLILGKDFKNEMNSEEFIIDLKASLEEYYQFYKPEGENLDFIYLSAINENLIKHFGYVMKLSSESIGVDFSQPKDIMLFEKVDYKQVSTEDIIFIKEVLSELPGNSDIKVNDLYICGMSGDSMNAAESGGGVVSVNKTQVDDFKSSCILNDNNIINLSLSDVEITEVAHHMFNLYLVKNGMNIVDNIGWNEAFGELVGLENNYGYFIPHFNTILLNSNILDRYSIALDISNKVNSYILNGDVEVGSEDDLLKFYDLSSLDVYVAKYKKEFIDRFKKSF